MAARMTPNREKLRARCWQSLAAASLSCLQACAASAEKAPEAPAQPALVGTPDVAPGTAPPQAIVDSPDRTSEDREADVRRHPVELLEFLGVRSGARVADLAAGSGYTTELLARAVGPSGVVYAQNDKATIDQYVSESWPKRLRRDATRNVIRMDREFDAPFSAEAHDLDLVTLLFSYHDVVARRGERSKLNAEVFRVLAPGGLYVVADHRAAPGTGLQAASTLHRIEEKVVRDEVEAAGFTFVESGEFLRDPSDDATEPSFKRGFATDRFILKFKKPEAS
jgi:predicted methyltransferase